MNKLLLSALVSLSVTAAMGQNKISPDGLAFLEQYRADRTATLKSMGIGTEAESNPTIAVIARLAEGYTAANIEAYGYTVTSDLGISAIVEVPLEGIDEFAALDAVSSLSFGGKKKPMMDFARKSAKVDDVHSGIEVNGAEYSFTGKGVLAGFFDTGLEANHVNFQDDSGNSRFQRLWYYRNSYNTNPTVYTSKTIKNFRTDNEGETHATHVGGILTGSYSGNGTYAYTAYSTGGFSLRTNKPIPYYGVAPDADIAAGVGVLGDPMILHGVENIIKHAESYDMPVVVNLSLGANIGPHDGTDDFTASLNELGKRGIICISAGNEADMDMSITKTFADGDTSFKTFLIPDADLAYGIDNYIDFWSEDGTPITVTISTYRIIDGVTTKLVSNETSNAASFTTTTGMITGKGSLISGIDANSGRYYARLSPSTALTVSANFRFMITVSGTAGKKVNVYYGGYGDFSSCNVNGFINGTPDESINTSAVAENLISVGSYSTRQVFGILGDTSGGYSSANDAAGKISAFSSYGTAPDGKTLPTVLAPGSTIISSYNQYYVTAAAASSSMTGKTTVGTSTYYWGFMDGTSMSSPFAAGVIALWLEADPTLNVDDVKNILDQTCVTDSYTKAKPAAAGYGKIDAAAGLRYILSNTAAIGTVTDKADDSRLLITRTGYGLEIVLGGEASFTVELYDLQGRLVSSANGVNTTANLSTSALQKGVYVVKVSGNGVNLSKKIAL